MPTLRRDPGGRSFRGARRLRGGRSSVPALYPRAHECRADGRSRGFTIPWPG